MYLSPKEAVNRHNAIAFPANHEPTYRDYLEAHNLRLQMLSDIVRHGYETDCRLVYAAKDGSAKYELAQTFGSPHLAAEFLDKILERSGPVEMAEVILTLMDYGHDQIKASYETRLSIPF